MNKRKFYLDKRNTDSRNDQNPDLYITAFSDASYRSETKAYGYGVWIKDSRVNEGKPVTFTGGGIGLKNSQEAESRGLEATVAFILEKLDVSDRVIVIQCDCLGALNRLDVQCLYDAGAQYVKLKHVYGHKGPGSKRSFVNNIVDDLAGKRSSKWHKKALDDSEKTSRHSSLYPKDLEVVTTKTKDACHV